MAADAATGTAERVRVDEYRPSRQMFSVARGVGRAGLATATGVAILALEGLRELGRVGKPLPHGYATVAIDRAAQRVLWSNDCGEQVECHDVTGGRALWLGDALDGYMGPRGLEQIAFDPSGALVLARVRRILRGDDWSRHVVVLDAATGEVTRRDFTEATLGTKRFGFDARGERLALGFEDGRLRVMSWPGAQVVLEFEPFPAGAPTAVAFGDGDELLVGSARGEVVIYRVR
jgi:hypothetical protein